MEGRTHLVSPELQEPGPATRGQSQAALSALPQPLPARCPQGRAVGLLLPRDRAGQASADPSPSRSQRAARTDRQLTRDSHWYPGPADLGGSLWVSWGGFLGGPGHPP